MFFYIVRLSDLVNTILCCKRQGVLGLKYLNKIEIRICKTMDSIGGYIYVITTDKPNIYKIGRTKTTVVKRIRSLQTGNVDDIQVLFELKVDNEVWLESTVHYALSSFRCSSNREHFTCDPEYIKSVILRYVNLTNTIKNESPVPTINTYAEEFIMTHLIPKSSSKIHCKLVWDIYNDWCDNNSYEKIKNVTLKD